MRRLTAKLMVWLLMVSYLLAATTASRFHHHDHLPEDNQEAARHAHLHDGHHHHAHKPHPQHFHPHGDEHDPVQIPDHEDDCFVCQFLAKTSTVAKRIVVDEVCDVVYDIAMPRLVKPHSPVLGLSQSRAPPAMAV